MKHIQSNNFKEVIQSLNDGFRHEASIVRSPEWHAQPNTILMRELLNVVFSIKVPDKKDDAEDLFEPNLPWANLHFKERISGLPLNPGESYKKWPFYKRDKEMRNEGEMFSHTYMERYWPTFTNPDTPTKITMGIRYPYGDLDDMIELLVTKPETRQAYLPIFFPEDTGALHGKRIPCSLGYHFILRDGYLHTNYYMRSCDYIRHFRDDMYLTARLAQYITMILNLKSGESNKYTVGMLDVHLVSLHIFEHEVRLLK